MPEPSLITRERVALRELTALTADRARAEANLTAQFGARKSALEKASRQARAEIEARYQSELAEAQADRDQNRAAIPARAQASLEDARARFEAQRKSVLNTFKKTKQQIEAEHDQTRWEATTIFEAGKSTADNLLKQREQRLAEASGHLDALIAALDDYLAHGHMTSLRDQHDPPEPTDPVPDDPLAAIDEANVLAGEQLNRIQLLTLPRLLQGGLYFFVCLLIFLALAIPGFILLRPATAVLVSVTGTLILGGLTCFGLYSAAKGQVAALYPELARTLARSDWLIERSREWIAEKDRRTRAELAERQSQEARKAERKATQLLRDNEERCDAELSLIEGNQARTLAEIQAAHDQELRAAEERSAHRIAEIEQRFRLEREAFEADDQKRRNQFQNDYDREWSALIQRWRQGIARWESEVASIQAECARLFHDWSDPASIWQPHEAVPPALRFGQFQIDRAKLVGGLPRDDRLKDASPERVDLPALLPFPEEKGSLVLRASGDARTPAVQLVQAVMLRLLTAVPPGKVRFTIVDPVGLGQNFAAFMHLADYDEQLVTSRIWTEPAHIERKLAEITEHMEKVIQKYLRNEYQSIQEYNAVAGEVAEPFRVLVVANFPSNFTEQAARRLVSIAQSGPKCGVYVLMSADPREPLPQGCTLADLEQPSTVVAWKEGSPLWNDPDFGSFPLTLDRVPADEPMTRLLHQVGSAAKDASRVEVPFDVVAPPPSEYWTEDTSQGIDIPLGRVGATKFQSLRLGKGTSQHVLIAGRTGSGKSTLLHALITNAALRYSPDQVELYLIDFKKGVEFKTYAAHHLPHARVIAIESEREFGLSVLQRLDGELKARGEAFRAAAVQDLAGFREARPDEPMPRVLLIVDEFQEFFVDDDKLAQEAALLLDRLVRQGRAFGIHVLLGSQTLGGAFSLARSTLGQMAVRIALQCSESDAHLILSEDNGAARLLSRPGEAIYNDANGMLEGNHFFQVVLLGDDRRDSYLNRVVELQRNDGQRPRPQIVFEGNIPADIEKNHLLRRLLDGPEPAQIPRAPAIWMGDAVAIKDPTAAVFRRQSGANLLIVGQNDEAAVGIALAMVVGFAAQFPGPASGSEAASPPSLRVFVLDGTPDDAPLDGILDQAANLLPGAVRVAGWRDVADILNETAEEVTRRQADRSYDEGAIVLMIHDLARFRDLRKSDDDFGFGFSRGEEEQRPSPAKQLGEILRDGPGVGVHVITWCDSLNNLNRSLDRQALREFEMRVLFQMSGNDSSALIDNPLAGRLGENRALFASEEEGRLEKFRPYGLPRPEWWNRVRDRLQERRESARIEAGR